VIHCGNTGNNNNLISPPEEDLKTAIISLNEAHLTLGITKFHIHLLSENPGGTVSEKRLRRILKNAEGRPLPRPSPLSLQFKLRQRHVYPSPRHHQMDGSGRGQVFVFRQEKRFVTKELVSEGQFVWKGDPFIIVSKW